MLAHVRVLVVDDDRRARAALAQLLHRAGAVVETAETAELARIRIALEPPDVVLCDVAMPGEDGNSFIRGLRASGRTMPVIALTAYAMEADVERSLDAGFDLHVAKPIDFERLVERIGELVAASGRTSTVTLRRDLSSVEGAVGYFVERQGGMIQVTSPGDNQGAVFTVRLPSLGERSAIGHCAEWVSPPLTACALGHRGLAEKYVRRTRSAPGKLVRLRGSP